MYCIIKLYDLNTECYKILIIYHRHDEYFSFSLKILYHTVPLLLHIFQIIVYSVSFSQSVFKSVNIMTVLAKQVGIETR